MHTYVRLYLNYIFIRIQAFAGIEPAMLSQLSYMYMTIDELL